MIHGSAADFFEILFESEMPYDSFYKSFGLGSRHYGHIAACLYFRQELTHALMMTEFDMPSNGSVNVPSKSNSTVSNRLTSSLQTYLTYYKKFLRQCQPTGKKCLTNNSQGSIIANENRCGFFLISHLFATQLLAVRRFFMQRR